MPYDEYQERVLVRVPTEYISGNQSNSPALMEVSLPSTNFDIL